MLYVFSSKIPELSGSESSEHVAKVMHRERECQILQSLVGKGSLFFLFAHYFVGIDQNKPALSYPIRRKPLTLRQANSPSRRNVSGDSNDFDILSFRLRANSVKSFQPYRHLQKPFSEHVLPKCIKSSDIPAL